MANERDRAFEAIQRLGAFGKLFVDYEGDPRGPCGRAGCMSLEDEALMMPVLTDVDGGKWVPVQEDVLRELITEYKALKNEIGDDPHINLRRCGILEAK